MKKKMVLGVNTSAIINSSGPMSGFIKEVHGEPFRTCYLVIYGAMFTPAVFGNLLIIASVLRYREMRSRYNILVANLAVSDFLVGVVAIPINISFIASTEISSNSYFCFFRHLTILVCTGSSINNLLVISVDRYMSVVYPLRYEALISRNKLGASVALSWGLSITSVSSSFVGANFWSSTVICDIYNISTKEVSLFLSSFGIAVLGLCFILYLKVMRTAWEKIRTVGCGLETLQFSSVAEIRKARTMMVVLGIFVLCWMPYFVLTSGSTFVDVSLEYKIVKNFFLAIGIFNSCLNFLIYGWMHKDFKKAFKNIMKSLWSCGGQRN